MQRAQRVAVAALVALAGLWALFALSHEPASADPPSPHVSAGAVTDTCASCHRSHTAAAPNLVKAAMPQSALCLSCHDGLGANTNVAAEYADVNVPTNNALTSSYYAHLPSLSSPHTSAKTDEFGGVLNRHADCADCHNPHTITDTPAVATASGWLASGSLAGITGVQAGSPPSWTTSVSYEYELCLKCHSGYTQLLSSARDKAQELSGSSYHPIAAVGTNTTEAMAQSLAGGALWQFATDSTIRCTSCHGDYRAVSPPATPGPQALLAPHTSQYRSILTASYRDRDLKQSGELYNSGDFALCLQCHSEAPFTDGSKAGRADTNFPLHGYHLTQIGSSGDGNLDINTAGAGQGNAICAECHFQLHSVRFSPWLSNQDNLRDVNFAPDVQPIAGQPMWSGPTDRTCSLVCHGWTHNGAGY